VTCASLVAERLPPGSDVLVLSTDKTPSLRRQTLDAMHLMSSAHDWRVVVDVSRLPTNALPSGARGFRQRLRRTLAARASVRIIEERLDPALPAAGRADELDERIDELYVNCLHHYDVQIFYKLFPSARKIYYPHSFIGLDGAHISYYERVLAGNGRSWTSRLADPLKGLLLGADAVPPRRVGLDAAYSLNLPAPWAAENVSLASALNQRTMRRLFERLPSQVTSFFKARAAECGERTIVLLLDSTDLCPSHVQRMALEGAAELTQRVIETEHADTVLLKPHPRSAPAWLRAAAEFLRARLGETKVVALDDYWALPSEVVLADFELAAVASPCSSALVSVARLHDVPAYVSEDLSRALYSYDAAIAAGIEIWIEENRNAYISI